ncbi:MAG: hypothetical protein ACE1Y4_10105 [Lysobacterales bacterium]
MLGEIAQFTVVGFLGSLAVIVGFKLLSGSINVAGLLADKETGAFSPGRLQLLLATLGGALFYFSQIVSADDPSALPPVPTELLLLLGGSNLGYLGGKIYSRFFRARRV